MPRNKPRTSRLPPSGSPPFVVGSGPNQSMLVSGTHYTFSQFKSANRPSELWRHARPKIWNYGSKLKYETEVTRKLPMDLMIELGCNLGTIRAPGIGLLHNELVKGVPAIFGQFITTLPAIHSIIISVCVKYVPVPVVPQNERFYIRRLCPKSYHFFRCIARYGYMDVRKENHQVFEQLLIDSLGKYIRREAQERQLESDGDEDAESEEDTSFSRVLVTPNGSVYSLGVPRLAEYGAANNSISEASTSEGE
ncbi:hypothetical protein F3Y22_tig00017701pilonHSYRG00006 [Hibiscus syriacus]|uniref:K+ potassium transporter C-terminal domain-containing protein n=1 Tax=Hibiscus syriacus TaxID=106335 RepID=A0A6A3BWH5_HIBSY|nr:hypothetical protein F3Y22_tig00017701pilonHSYRG00006 [Hibiscus syriacus]